MFKESNKFEKFESKVWLSSPTMHGPEIEYVKEAYETNWMSTVGKNINEVEKLACEYIGCKYAVALSAGTASLHLAMKLAGIEAYGMPKVGHGALEGKKVFCSDMTFDATVNPVVYEWSTQARENAAWYQHEELGYNYRMSNVVAGVVRGQFPYLNEHIAQKKAIYERYKEGLKGLPVSMNPMNLENSEPNYWLSCLIIDKKAMCKQVRGEQDVCYIKETGKTCPTEILEAIASINAEGRPVWKPMHMQPIYRLNPFVVKDGNGRARSNAYIAGSVSDVGMDIFNRGLCLPSDNKMTVEQQERIIEVIRACFE